MHDNAPSSTTQESSNTKINSRLHNKWKYVNNQRA